MNIAKYKQIEIGEIPEGWRKATLGGTAIFNYGKSLPQKERSEGGVPVYGSSGITGYHNKPLVEEKGYIVGRKGTIGTVYYSQKPFFPIDTTYYITSEDINCDFDYFYYLLKYLHLDQLNYDSAVPGLNRNIAYQQKFTIPTSIGEQKQIADILSSLDKKIELNRKMNQTLEDIGKAIFKHWFVDFEFPNEDGKPYKSSGGEMVNSELGEIPNKWKIEKLGMFADIHNGFAFKSADYRPKGTTVVRTRDFSDGGFVDLNEPVYLPEKFTESHNKYLLNKFDILLVMVGASVGKLVLVPSKVLPAMQNQNMWRFRVKDKGQFFLKYLLDELVKQNLRAASGSARSFFRKDHFRSIPIIMPDVALLSRFESVVRFMFERIDINLLESKRLIQSRDLLLPRLMSGRIRV